MHINAHLCKGCGKTMKYYDSVSRLVRIKEGQVQWIKIARFQCKNCQKIHRILPKALMPYKQYEAYIIEGVRRGFITSDTLGYEDYPCEMTMTRWRSR